MPLTLPFHRRTRVQHFSRIIAPDFYSSRFSIFYLFLFCLPLFLATSLSALADSQEPKSALKTLSEGVKRWTLPNGIRVIFYQRKTAPVFAGQIWVRAGGVDERPGITGIAHFLEHMAFKGTRTIGTKDYTKEAPLLAELEKIIISSKNQDEALQSPEVTKIYGELEQLWVDNELGRIYTNSGANGFNAMTSKDYTSYVVRLPGVAFELWCWLESDRILNPVFRQFYKEREVVQEERRSGYDNDPGGKLYEQLLQLAFTQHPNRLPVIGYPEDLKKLTATEMSEFYAAHYLPENMVISLVGDLDEDTVRVFTDRYFSRMTSAAKVKSEPIASEPPQTSERKLVLPLDAEPQVYLAYHKPTGPDPDDARFSVLHSLLSEGRSSLFSRVLVEEEHLALGADTGEAPGERYDNLFMVAATPAKGVTSERLVAGIQRLLDGFKSTPPDATLVEEAKKRSRLSFIKLLDSDEGLATALGKSEVLHNGWEELISLYDAIEKTTPEDIQELARKYLNIENRTVAEIKKSPIKQSPGAAK